MIWLIDHLGVKLQRGACLRQYLAVRRSKRGAARGGTSVHDPCSLTHCSVPPSVGHRSSHANGTRRVSVRFALPDSQTNFGKGCCGCLIGKANSGPVSTFWVSSACSQAKRLLADGIKQKRCIYMRRRNVFSDISFFR